MKMHIVRFFHFVKTIKSGVFHCEVSIIIYSRFGHLRPLDIPMI